MTDARLVKLIEDVLSLVTGKRVATKTAQRLAEEIIGDGYIRTDIHGAENERLREALLDVGSSLVAAVSILERSAEDSRPANEVVASDKMFRQMIVDYKKSIQTFRTALEDGDMMAYHRAASAYFQDRHVRAMIREASSNEIERLEAESKRLREALLDVGSSLVTAVWILEKSAEGSMPAYKVVASDKMLRQMIVDYKKSIQAFGAALEDKG